MSNASALRVAIDLVLLPSRVRMLKAEPLPQGVPLLLRIAAGDGDAAQEAAEMTGKPEEIVQAAAGFFIEQILFDPEANSYRVLGAPRDATAAQLRFNLAMLVKWLHADSGQNSQRSVFVVRVTGAWNNLKTPERRAAYDMARNLRGTEHRTSRAGRSNGLSISPVPHGETRYMRASNSGKMREPPRAIGVHGRERHGLLRRVILFVFGRRGR